MPGTEDPARGGRGERPGTPGGGCPGAGAASPLGGRRRAGVRGGEEVGPGGRGGGRLRGSPPPARPSAAPFCSGCCGDQRQQRRALRREARGDGSPASCSQVSAGRRAPLPARGRRLPGPAGPRGARSVHEAGLARPPRAVTGPAARPARPHPGPSPRGPRMAGHLRSPPGSAGPPRTVTAGAAAAHGASGRAAGSPVGVPPGAGLGWRRSRLLPGPRPPVLGPRVPGALSPRSAAGGACGPRRPCGDRGHPEGRRAAGPGCRLFHVCFLVSYKGCAK